MADEPLQTDVALTKEQIEWVLIALHQDITRVCDDEPQEFQYETMSTLMYHKKQFKFCSKCYTHYVQRWSTDTHTGPPKEEE